jgi:type III restriction enzyme
LIYRLTPLDAYKRGLVKKIEVAGLVETGTAKPYIELMEIVRGPRHIKARVRVQQLMTSGVIVPRIHIVRSGDDLEAKTHNPLYRGYQVDEVNVGFVSFTNGMSVYQGQAVGPDREAIWRSQIRYTVETHFHKQRFLTPHGVKVLTLFFVDHVKDYIDELGTEGLVRRLFREEFQRLTCDSNYANWQQFLPGWKGQTVENLQAAYFAQKVSRRGVAYFEEESNQEARDAFQQAYQLIMREKERLLSWDEPVAFIFSHSALREGWDNPNIFQICPLHHTASLIRKRQEIGRGVRLSVNQNGERIMNQTLNRLTVISNQSYEDYARQLQAEFVEDGTVGYEPSKAPETPSEHPRDVYRRTDDLTNSLFGELWNAINHRTRYRISLDSERLIREVVTELDHIEIPHPQVTVSKAVLEVRGDELVPEIAVADRTYGEASKPPMPNLLELINDHLQRTSYSVRLTRRTILEILRGTQNPGMQENPDGFAQAVARILKEKLVDQLSDGICYEKMGQWYKASQMFLKEFTAYADCIKQEANDRSLTRFLYEAMEVESEVEERFTDQLEQDSQVLLYIKLPKGFVVQTPLGDYIPDWAVLVEQRGIHGITINKLYLIRETKDTKVLSELMSDELEDASSSMSSADSMVIGSCGIILYQDFCPGEGA